MRLFIVAILGAIFLAGCGVKPGGVEPPTPKGDTFPRTYPNTGTDPNVIDDQDPSPYSPPHQGNYGRW